MPAYGKTSQDSPESYRKKLMQFDLNTPRYNQNTTPIDFLLQKVNGFANPDYIFIDSRSGIHQVGGITITRYPDLAVMFFLVASKMFLE